jgi:hypothetical protein
MNDEVMGLRYGVSFSDVIMSRPSRPWHRQGRRYRGVCVWGGGGGTPPQ